MAGERGGGGRPQGLYGRLSVHLAGTGVMSGFAEAALDRALADPAWVEARLDHLRAGRPGRTRDWARDAVLRLAPEVSWAACHERADARHLEVQVDALLRPSACGPQQVIVEHEERPPWHDRRMPADTSRDVAEAAWRWVSPRSGTTGPLDPGVRVQPGARPSEQRDGLHSGIGGLALALAEVRASRAWTPEEQTLADALADRLQARTATTTAYDYFDGLVGDLAALVALGADGADAVVDRLIVLADGRRVDPGGRRSAAFPPRGEDQRRHPRDGSVLLGGIWAHRHGVARADELVTRSAEVLMAEAEELPAGLRWRFVRCASAPRTTPPRCPTGPTARPGSSPRWRLAGAELGRPDWIEAARVALSGWSPSATSPGWASVPRYVPDRARRGPGRLGWCHGAEWYVAAVRRARPRRGPESPGAAPDEWRRRCLQAVRTSGVPQRLRPGFWDNDGRCCGTAGVGDVVRRLAAAEDAEADLDFALRLA